MTVRTRFAPSPTGLLHVGGVRTALFCWLYARHHGGEFVLRVEDTDRERSTQQSVDAILESLAWLEIDADIGPIYQTERMERYQLATQKLLDTGDAYHCYCTPQELDDLRTEQREKGLKPRYNRRCRDGRDPVEGIQPVVRFKTPLQGEVTFNDHVRGTVTVSNDELDDLVICRSDGMPTYNFAVVVDDAEMQITHVVRGDDHINNTPRQINLFQALGYSIPEFAHVPMILGEDGARLSKRHGAVGASEYRDAGYLPEALVNYLVRLGWSHGDQEIFSRDEMVAKFELSDVNRAPSTFNTEKLDWLNQHYLKQATTERLSGLYRDMAATMELELPDDSDVDQICLLWRERVSTVRELVDATRFIFEYSPPDKKAADRHLTAASAPILDRLLAGLSAVDEWRAGDIKMVIQTTVDDLDIKLGKVAAPTRLAITGTLGGADLDRTLEVVGREQVLDRLANAISVAQNA